MAVRLSFSRMRRSTRKCHDRSIQAAVDIAGRGEKPRLLRLHRLSRISLYDEGTSSLSMKIVEEFVLARRERTDIDGTLGSGGDDLLDPKRYALEFHGGCIEILDHQDDRPIGGRMDFGRLKTMTFNRDLDRRSLLGVQAAVGENHCGRKYQHPYNRPSARDHRSHVASSDLD